MNCLRLWPGLCPMKIFVFCLTVATLFFLPAVTCQADVLYIHDYRITEYVVGTKDAELAVGYADQGMFIDKISKYTGSWMKRIFGEEKEHRETTQFLLDKNQIIEIDWYKGGIIVLPFENLKDITWIKEQQKNFELADEILRERYKVLKPELSINILPKKEKFSEYLCMGVEANLRLETRDLKKKAASVTLVRQKLWLSDAVPGFNQHNDFHNKLAEKLGLDAERLGNLSFLLRYWNGSLDPVREHLKNVRGYPVRSLLTVEARYTTGTDTDSPKTVSKQIKEELIRLKKVDLNKLDKKRFMPSEFKKGKAK